jgi:DNA primase
VSASVEKVLERLALTAKKHGSRWWFERCPNPDHADHNEQHRWKNAFVRGDGHRRAGQWTCFSCHAGGLLVELVMAVMKLEFREARDWLMNVEEAPAPEPVVRVRYAPMGARDRVFRLPEGVEFAPLERWNSVARSYAVGRGLDAEQVARWGVGYALIGRCAGRIVFPIVDSTARLVNYAARTFVGDETRYLAADERESPDTAAMLGELFWPPVATRVRRTVVVFEGALSGMALERAMLWAGISGELAGLQGSDVTHPRRLLRLSGFGRVVAATDPDAAGERATFDLEAGLRGVPVTRLRYPSKLDAADTPVVELAAALSESFGAGPGSRHCAQG